MKLRKQGFTLVELLIVILIIGILTAVALPRYEKVVERARAAEGIGITRSVYTAVKAYYDEFHECPASLDYLAVKIPWTGTTQWHTVGPNPGDHKISQAKSNDRWSVQLYHDLGHTDNTTGANDEFGCAVIVGRISGKYAGTGWGMFLFPMYSSGTGTMPTDRLICIQGGHSEMNPTYSGAYNSYCINIFGATALALNHANKFFEMDK